MSHFHCAEAIIARQTHPGMERIVPIAEAGEFLSRNPGWQLGMVVWHDGKKSYGKIWRFGGTNTVARIGAGANGDLTVWEHIVPPWDMAARKAAGLEPGY